MLLHLTLVCQNIFLLNAGGKINKNFYCGKLSCVKYEKVKEPELLGDDWVKVKTIYGGICGSDINLVFLNDTPLFHLLCQINL